MKDTKKKTKQPPKVSIVIPLHNEEESILWVHKEICEVMSQDSMNWEVVYVDDGSTDRTRELLRSLASSHGHVRIVCLNRNYGQAVATMAGADYTYGDIVVVMDGDGQHDPRDILKLVSKIDEGYDVVSGWRERRNDDFLTRRLPSLVANKMLARVSGLELRDFGTSLKAYRRILLSKLRMSDGLHRFVPILAAMHTTRITEMPINWRERKMGVSKYNLSRTSAVLFDIFAAWFLTRYGNAPLRLLGKLGMSMIVPSVGGIGVMSVWWAFAGLDMVANRGTLILFVFMGILGLQFFCTGFIGELLAQALRESRKNEAYLVTEVIE